MKQPLSHILKQADQAPSKSEKIAVLRQNISRQLLDILIAAYDDRIKWLLPTGPVPYKPCTEVGVESMLFNQTRTLYLYVDSGIAPPTNLTNSRRQQLFITLLQAVHPDDAELLVSIKDKTLPFKTLTKDLVAEAFPNTLFFGKSTIDEQITNGIQVDTTTQVDSNIQPSDSSDVVKPKRGRGRPKSVKTIEAQQKKKEIQDGKEQSI